MKTSILLMLWIASAVTHSSANYCLYGDRSDCAFECHCAVRAECGGSGVCTSGCGHTGIEYETRRRWTGNTCQIGNIAAGKPANQSSTNPPLSASKAVDGRSANTSHCAHTNGTELGEFWLDLGDLYKIYNITIYNRKRCCQERLSYTRVGVIDSNKETQCAAIDRVTGERDLVLPLTCRTPLVGRYVHIARYQEYAGWWLTLCEVIAIGHKYINCSKANCPGGVPCNDVIGCTKCIGTYPPYCKTECDDGFYGNNCEEPCVNCAEGTTCNKINGDCQGCQDGSYGRLCKENCGRCLNTKCNQDDGSCSECELWWTDNKCMTHIGYPTKTTEDIIETTSGSDFIGVKWRPLVTVPVSLVGYYQYTLRYQDKQTSIEQDGPVVKHTATATLLTVITGLRHNTEYDVSVVPQRVMRGVSEGNPDNTQYDPVSVKTKCSAPDLSQLGMNLTSNEEGNEMSEIHVSFQILWTLDNGCDSIKKALLEHKIITESGYHGTELNFFDRTFVIKPALRGRYEVRISVTNNRNLSSSVSKYIEIGDDYEYTTIRSPGSEMNDQTTCMLYMYLMIALGILLLLPVGCLIALTVIYYRLKKRYKSRTSSSRNEAGGANSSHKLSDKNDYNELTLERVEPKNQRKSPYEAPQSPGGDMQEEPATYEEL